MNGTVPSPGSNSTGDSGLGYRLGGGTDQLQLICAAEAAELNDDPSSPSPVGDLDDLDSGSVGEPAATARTCATEIGSYTA